MTDTEQKALAQAVAAAGRRMQDYNIMAEENVLRQSIEAHARAIEQHEAFRQEVSDAVEGYNDLWRKRTPGRDEFMGHFIRFIIAKPDPLVEAMNDSLDRLGAFERDEADRLRAAIEKRGGKITWGEG